MRSDYNIKNYIFVLIIWNALRTFSELSKCFEKIGKNVKNNLFKFYDEKKFNQIQILLEKLWKLLLLTTQQWKKSLWLISWCGNIVEILRKLSVSTKFQNMELSEIMVIYAVIVLKVYEEIEITISTYFKKLRFGVIGF